MGWWKKLPYLDRERWLFPYFFCGLFIFIFGGVTGIINASYNLEQRHPQHFLAAGAFPSNRGRSDLSFLHRDEFVLVAKLTGREIKSQRLNVWMPYIWTLGIMIFSTGLFIGGAGGEPRRTNMGLTYTNPQSRSLSRRLAGRENLWAALAELS